MSFLTVVYVRLLLFFVETDQTVTLATELAQKSLLLVALYAIKEGPDEPAQMFSLASDFALVYTKYSKTCAKRSISKRPKIGFQAQLSLTVWK